MNVKTESIVCMAAGLLSGILIDYGLMLILVCSFIGIDLLTGLVRAKLQEGLNSRAGYKGFWRKMALLTALAFGICLDFFIDYISTLGIISVSISSPIGHIIGVYIAVNECISICENLAACEVKIPKWVKAILSNIDNDISPN